MKGRKKCETQVQRFLSYLETPFEVRIRKKVKSDITGSHLDQRRREEVLGVTRTTDAVSSRGGYTA